MHIIKIFKMEKTDANNNIKLYIFIALHNETFPLASYQNLLYFFCYLPNFLNIFLPFEKKPFFFSFFPLSTLKFKLDDGEGFSELCSKDFDLAATSNAGALFAVCVGLGELVQLRSSTWCMLLDDDGRD